MVRAPPFINQYTPIHHPSHMTSDRILQHPSHLDAGGGWAFSPQLKQHPAHHSVRTLGSLEVQLRLSLGRQSGVNEPCFEGSVEDELSVEALQCHIVVG